MNIRHLESCLTPMLNQCYFEDDDDCGHDNHNTNAVY